MHFIRKFRYHSHWTGRSSCSRAPRRFRPQELGHQVGNPAVGIAVQPILERQAVVFANRFQQRRLGAAQGIVECREIPRNQVAHALGKQTIAEFAENEEIITMLRGMGIDYAQGYGVSEPKRVTSAVAFSGAPGEP